MLACLTASKRGNYLYLDLGNGRVYMTEHNYTAKPLVLWDSLPDMLLSECERLEKLYTINGLEIERPPSLDENILEGGKALWVKAMKERLKREKAARKKLAAADAKRGF